MQWRNAARLLEGPATANAGRGTVDVARYSDTKHTAPAVSTSASPYAYTYRDWAIAALNADMPYDQFLTQLAADKLPDQKSQSNLAALGFLTINDYFRSLQIDDRIDVVSRDVAA